MSYFGTGRYGGILEDWKKDPQSHSGPPDGIVTQKHLMFLSFGVVSYDFMDYLGLFSESRPSS